MRWRVLGFLVRFVVALDVAGFSCTRRRTRGYCGCCCCWFCCCGYGRIWHCRFLLTSHHFCIFCVGGGGGAMEGGGGRGGSSTDDVGGGGGGADGMGGVDASCSGTCGKGCRGKMNCDCCCCSCCECSLPTCHCSTVCFVRSE